jgi:hypothetical protein
MTQEIINKMAKDLIRMCDAVEKHGLVDYQYGVAEEQIMLSKYALILKTGILANHFYSSYGMSRSSRINRRS